MNELTRFRLNQTNRPCDVVLHWHDRGMLDLNAPYQRGDVWGDTRRRNLIKSIIIGIPIPSIIINDRFFAGWGKDGTYAVIDGKQRITAVLKFMTGQLTVPGEWFGQVGNITWSDLNEVDQRRFHNHPIPFTEGQLKSLDEEREVFDLVNFGGIPQGQSDL